jgi:hypothetical protein
MGSTGAATRLADGGASEDRAAGGVAQECRHAKAEHIVAKGGVTGEDAERRLDGVGDNVGELTDRNDVGQQDDDQGSARVGGG